MFNFRNIYVLLKPSICRYSQKIALPLRSLKPKSTKNLVQSFVDTKAVKVLGGKGGDGCISFLHLYLNEMAGPDGGDGGNGAHVILKASYDVKDLSHFTTIIKGMSGENGRNKDRHGKSADHLILKVPIGTIIKNIDGIVVGDLAVEDNMFVAARGGAGGKGNHFFISDIQQAPEICEFGANGEDLEYTLEVRSMAHMGLIGFPNAGKSTLLRAISRARPKVAPYPFTTLKPHIGMVQYDDYEQIAVADLPGLIKDSHKNKGLGIQFLKHAERCLALIYIVDVSTTDSLEQFEILQDELAHFSEEMFQRPKLVLANKIDLISDDENIKRLKKLTDLPVIPISAKLGTNVTEFLLAIRNIYDDSNKTTK